jgi:3-oxoacyl-[acyl-carrier protein] reductase
MTMERRALVTGAQQGIGAAAAVALAKAGADVAINWLDDLAAAQEVATAVESVGRRAVLLQGDVGTAAGATALTERAAEALGGLEILVNNAGIFPATDPLEVSEAEWDKVLAVNLKGTFFCAQAAAKAMIAGGRGGAIVNMSSVTIMGTGVGPHYVASKGAVVAMTRSLATSFAPHKIRVNAIAPGVIDTAQPRALASQEVLDEMARTQIPLRRIGDVGDIAEMIVFLTGSGADYITGQTIHVNGGQLMW